MSDIQNPPEQTRTTLNRVLLGVVIVLGLLIVAAFVALVYGAVSGWSKLSTAAPPEVASLQQLPPGARIIEMKVDNGRAIVHLKGPNGEEIDIYDTATGKLITRIVPPQR